MTADILLDVVELTKNKNMKAGKQGLLDAYLGVDNGIHHSRFKLKWGISKSSIL